MPKNSQIRGTEGEAMKRSSERTREREWPWRNQKNEEGRENFSKNKQTFNNTQQSVSCGDGRSGVFSILFYFSLFRSFKYLQRTTVKVNQCRFFKCEKCRHCFKWLFVGSSDITEMLTGMCADDFLVSSLLPKSSLFLTLFVWNELRDNRDRKRSLFNSI